jgi:hypothetical protein
MTIEVDEVVRVAGLLTGAEHLLHARHGGRAAEIHAHAGAERIEGLEERLRREPGIDEARIGRSADDVEDAQGEIRRARCGLLRLFQLSTHRYPLCEPACIVGHELPGQPQQRRVLGDEGQLAGFRGGQELLQEVAVLFGCEQGVVERVAPSFEVAFDALSPGDRAAIGQVHVFFEVPAQVLVIALGQEGRERDLDAECGAVGGAGEIALVFGGFEEDAEFLHRRFPRLRPTIPPVSEIIAEVAILDSRRSEGTASNVLGRHSAHPTQLLIHTFM